MWFFDWISWENKKNQEKEKPNIFTQTSYYTNLDAISFAPKTPVVEKKPNIFDLDTSIVPNISSDSIINKPIVPVNQQPKTQPQQYFQTPANIKDQAIQTNRKLLWFAWDVYNWWEYNKLQEIYTDIDEPTKQAMFWLFWEWWDIKNWLNVDTDYEKLYPDLVKQGLTKNVVKEFFNPKPKMQTKQWIDPLETLKETFQDMISWKAKIDLPWKLPEISFEKDILVKWLSKTGIFVIDSLQKLYEWLSGIGTKMQQDTNPDIYYNDYIESKFQDKYWRMYNPKTDKQLVQNIIKEIPQNSEEFQSSLREKIQIQDIREKSTTLNQDILKVWAWLWSTAVSTTFPMATALLWIWSETPIVKYPVEWLWILVNHSLETAINLPWVREYTDRLETQEDRENFKEILWSSLFLLMWTKWWAWKTWGSSILNQPLWKIFKITNEYSQKFSEYMFKDLPKSMPVNAGTKSFRWGKFKWWTKQNWIDIESLPIEKQNELYQNFIPKTNDIQNRQTKPQVATPQWENIPQWQPTQAWVKPDWFWSKVNDFVKTYASELDLDVQKSIKTNPYTKSYWDQTMKKIDTEGVPTDLKQLIREPLQEVGTNLLKEIEKEESRLSDSWPLYETIRQNKEYIDILPAQKELPALLKNKDISIMPNWKLNFSRSAIISETDITAIKKIYNRIMEADRLNWAELLNLRKFADWLAKWDKWVSWDGIYIIKQMRKAVDNIAKEKMSWLKELDMKYAWQLKDIQDAKEWLFYRDIRRRWQVKDNFISILKNLWWENRSRIRNSVLRIMPDADPRIEAILMIPKLAKAYSTPSSITKKVWWVIGWWVIGYTVWQSRLWAVIGWAIAELVGNKIFTGLKKSQIRNIIDRITPEWQKKLKEINDKIEQRKTLLKEEKDYIDRLKQRIERENRHNLKQLWYNPKATPEISTEWKIKQSIINTPQPSKVNDYTVKESYWPDYINPQEKVVQEQKKQLLKKKEEDTKIAEEKSQKLAEEKAMKEEENITEFLRVKENWTLISDSNTWRDWDTSPKWTLDKWIVMDGTKRMVQIDWILYPESEVRPVYREKLDIQPKDFWIRKQSYLQDWLDALWVKNLEELPKEFQDRLIEIANQWARWSMAKLSDKIDKLINDREEYKKPSKKEVIVKPKQPLISKKDITNDLIQEARKYKTAEEFINSKEKVYHWTNAEFDKFDLSKIWSQTDEWVRWRWIYFTPNKEMAKSTIRWWNAKYIKEFIINKDKLFDISKYKDVGKMADDLDMREWNFTKWSDWIIRPVLSQNWQFTSHVEDLWYEWVYVNRWWKWDELVIFNPENIKTESQLKQIREEANNTSPWKEENKEYNSTKKSLISKKDTNDWSKLQTEQWGNIWQSNWNKQVSLIDSQSKIESWTKGEDTGIQLKWWYSSDNAITWDGYGTWLPVSKSKQWELNRTAIDILNKHEFSKNPSDYTTEEIQSLLKYEWWGWVSKWEWDTSWANDEFYTPIDVISTMRYLAKKYWYKESATILEPSAWIGRFIRNKPMWTWKATWYEIDKTSWTIAAITNPDALIKIWDYQDQFMDFTWTRPLSLQEIKDKPKYDIVIWNPPYKERTTKQRNLWDLKHVNRFEDYFMIRWLQQLNLWWTMTVIVPSSFLDKPHYAAKQTMQDIWIQLVDAYRLPNKTFPNTDVGTDILVFKKLWWQLESETMIQFQLMSNWERFKQNPSKILWEVWERTNRFWKLETFVKWEPKDVLNIIKEDIKEKVETTSNEINKLTMTDPITSKQEPITNSNISNIEKPTIEKKPLITQKTKSAEPTTTKEISQPKSTINTISWWLFDIPTEKEAIKVADKILNPIVEEPPKWLSNRILWASNLDMADVQKLVSYQKITNTLWEVQWVSVTDDPKLLNYMDWDVYVNYNYFSWDIYGKLDQLELDKSKISDTQYQKQKAWLLEVLPTPQTLDNMTFNVTRDDIMNTPVPELKTVSEYVFDPVTKRNNRVEKEVTMTIKDKFKQRLREDWLPSRSRVSAHEIIWYFEWSKMTDKDRKGMIIEDANRYFDKFIKEALDTDIQEQLVRKENIESRNIAEIDTTKVPFIIENLSETFRWNNLNFKEIQTNSAIKAAMKWSYIVSLWAWYGKTMVWVLATVRNMQNWFTKRPLIIVPKQTMKWREETIKGLFPTYKLNVLWSLDTVEQARQYKARWKDISKWIEDNSITLMTHEAYVWQLSFTDATINKVLSELSDDMYVEWASKKQSQSSSEKTEADITAASIGKINKKNVNMNMFDADRVAEQYKKMQTMTHEEFINSFVESDLTKNPLAKQKAEELLSIEPLYIEKMWFDMMLMDELHNAKNIFEKAAIQEVDGRKWKNMFWEVKWATSMIGKKVMIWANYMQTINNGRWFIGLTATPFNNQAIEIYNMMHLVWKSRLKKMGINNMNDFMSKFSEFKEELVVQLGKVWYKSIQKWFVNLQSMQKLVNEHIDFKWDDPEIIKPELIKKYITLQMSDLQIELQQQIEIDMMDKTKPWAMIAWASNARVNNVSPYFTSMWKDMNFTPEELLKNSPKLDFFADMIIEKNKLWNHDLAIMFIPFWKELHGTLAEALSKKTWIPMSKIWIINSDPKYKKKMFETINKANNWEIEILIWGKTINEWVDLQHKWYIVYDVIMWWNPTEPIQKTARVRRQWNLRNYTTAVYPALENSIDSFMFQKVEEKTARINDIFSWEWEVFDTTDVDPALEKLALITDPIKKAQVFIEIEQKRLQRSIDIVKWEISDIEKRKADISEEINTLPNIMASIETYKGYSWDYSEYIQTLKKQADSIKWKAKRARDNVEKRWINIEAELRIKERELELLNTESKEIQDQLPSKIKEYTQQANETIANRKSRKYYLDEINEITKQLEIFKTTEEQKTFKKSLLSKK